MGYWDEDAKKGYGQDISINSEEVLKGIWNENELIMPDSPSEN